MENSNYFTEKKTKNTSHKENLLVQRIRSAVVNSMYQRCSQHQGYVFPLQHYADDCMTTENTLSASKHINIGLPQNIQNSFMKIDSQSNQTFYPSIPTISSCVFPTGRTLESIVNSFPGKEGNFRMNELQHAMTKNDPKQFNAFYLTDRIKIVRPLDRIGDKRSIFKVKIYDIVDEINSNNTVNATTMTKNTKKKLLISCVLKATIISNRHNEPLMFDEFQQKMSVIPDNTFIDQILLSNRAWIEVIAWSQMLPQFFYGNFNIYDQQQQCWWCFLFIPLFHSTLDTLCQIVYRFHNDKGLLEDRKFQEFPELFSWKATDTHRFCFTSDSQQQQQIITQNSDLLQSSINHLTTSRLVPYTPMLEWSSGKKNIWRVNASDISYSLPIQRYFTAEEILDILNPSHHNNHERNIAGFENNNNNNILGDHCHMQQIQSISTTPAVPTIWPVVLFDFMAQILLYLMPPFKQRFSFCHNDFKIDNIAYVKTDKEYCYVRLPYKQPAEILRIPTHNRLFIPIDFGWCSMSIQAKNGNTKDRLVISSFDPDRLTMKLDNKLTDIAQLAYSMLRTIYFCMNKLQSIDTNTWGEFIKLLGTLAINDKGVLTKFYEYWEVTMYAMASRCCNRITTEDIADIFLYNYLIKNDQDVIDTKLFNEQEFVVDYYPRYQNKQDSV